MRRSIGSLAALVLLGTLLVACGGSDSNSSSKPATTAKRPASTAAATSTTAAATTTTKGAATVKTGNTGLGTILVDDSGKTLYAFANDNGTTSACTGGCASIWPPLMAAGSPAAGAGVDASKLSAAPSGQVVYGGH